MARLSRSLHAWVAELLSVPYDEANMAARWRVGHRHAEIGLAQRYASLALARLWAGIVRSFEREFKGDAQELAAVIRSLHKLLDLEHALTQDAYEFENVRHERHVERERSERKFRHVVENTNRLIVILSPDQGVVYINHCAERTTGYSAEGWRRQRGARICLALPRGRDDCPAPIG